MSFDKNYVRRRTLMKDFIFIELSKRHLEYYDYETYNSINQIKNEMLYEYDDECRNNVFINCIANALDMYINKKNNMDYHKSPDLQLLIDENESLFDFENPSMTKYYNELERISQKYNILAPDLMYPSDLSEIILLYKSDYVPRVSYRLDKRMNEKFLIKTLENDKIIIHTKRDTLEEGDIYYLLYQIIINKIVNNIEIGSEYNEFFEKYEHNFNKETFRLESFIRNIIGMYKWDCIVSKKHDDTFELYRKYYKKNNKNINKNIANYCKSKDLCPNCVRRDSCEKYIREAYRLASISIKQR